MPPSPATRRHLHGKERSLHTAIVQPSDKDQCAIPVVRHRRRVKYFVMYGSLFLLAVWIFLLCTYVGLKVLPEVGMIVNSQCKDPLYLWDGKILGLRIAKGGFWFRPRHFNIHYDIDVKEVNRAESPETLSIPMDRRRLLAVNGSNNQLMGIHSPSSNGPKTTGRPLIIWASHHKTGTYLAQKLFALLCSHFRWCCIFHVTRDSIHALKYSLSQEPVHVLGHTQWIWHPEEIAGGLPYRFVHFVRHPWKKIISGYRYHKEGTEAWTKKHLHFDATCNTALRHLAAASSSSALTHSDSANHAGNHSRIKDALSVERKEVVEHCKTVHLCETCCRREHERYLSPLGDANKPRHTEGVPVNSRYALRDGREYDWICNTLGKVQSKFNQGAVAAAKEQKNTNLRPVSEKETMETPTLFDVLNGIPTAQGLPAEAALQFYENIRMARIYNATINDPNSLNVDIDIFERDFPRTVRRILRHLDLDITDKELNDLATEISFFDLKSSTLYRWSMGLINHIHKDRSEGTVGLIEFLKRQDDIVKVYRPVFDLMRIDPFKA